MNINQNISDNPADKDSAGFYDPSTESFPTSLEGKVLFYIAIAFLMQNHFNITQEQDELIAEDLLHLKQSLVDSINHLLNQLDLAVSQPVFVGDIIGDTSLTTRFTTGSSRLEVKSFTACLKYLDTFFGVS